MKIEVRGFTIPDEKVVCEPSSTFVDLNNHSDEVQRLKRKYQRLSSVNLKNFLKRICIKCKTEKWKHEFNDGSTKCKECGKEYSKQYRKKKKGAK